MRLGRLRISRYTATIAAQQLAKSAKGQKKKLALCMAAPSASLNTVINAATLTKKMPCNDACGAKANWKK